MERWKRKELFRWVLELLGKICKLYMLCSFLSLFLVHSYAEVRTPGFLHFYKDKRTADAHRYSADGSRSTDPQATVIDLRLVNDFKVPDRRNKDNLELDLEMGDETIKLK
jgi:hypothetical protein